MRLNGNIASAYTRFSLKKRDVFAGMLFSQSSLYQEMLAEREEILRHKWLLSEHAGYDVGFSAAAYDWIANHRTNWRKTWRKRRSVPAK